MVDGAGAEDPVRTSDLAVGGSAILQQVHAPASVPEQVPAAAAPRTVSFVRSSLLSSSLLSAATPCLTRPLYTSIAEYVP